MFRLAVLLSCTALCCSHAVLPHLPVAVPAVHSVPLVAYPGYAHGYGHSLLGHGFLAKPLGHHIFKRSPHVVGPLAHHVSSLAPFAPVAHVAPVAVSHQSRYDVRTAPVVAALAVVKPVVAPVVTAPFATSFHELGHYGHGGYASGLGGYAGGLGGYGGHAGHGLGHGHGNFGHY